MTRDQIIQNDNNYVMHTYGRLDVVPESGKNAVLKDKNGKKYIDFTSGIGVNSLGWCDDGWVSAVKSQLERYQHISNYYYSEPTEELAEMLIKATGMKKVFFGNSGAEANEGAIKLARKYSYDKYGEGRSTIITLNNSFHGRTVTTLAATGQDSFHKFFFPFTEGFVYTPINDICSLKAALDIPGVCAVMAEAIQGEGGVNLMTDEYAAEMKRICDEKDILIIFDEVQTGAGRTGRFLASSKFGFLPDIVTLAKGLGGGLPIGVFLGGEKCENTLTPGQHGTTFGGNPVVCAGACEVMRRICNEKFLEEVSEKGRYIVEALKSSAHKSVKEIRGDGMMIGIEIEGDPKKYLKAAQENGLLVLTAGKNVIRLLPPLSITYEELDIGIKILNNILEN